MRTINLLAYVSQEQWLSKDWLFVLDFKNQYDGDSVWRKDFVLMDSLVWLQNYFSFEWPNLEKAFGFLTLETS